MPNWTTNVFKIFVPAETARLVPMIMAALAEPEAEIDDLERDDIVWIDFKRLLPIPQCLLDTPDSTSTAVVLASGGWPKHLKCPAGMEIPRDPEARIALAEEIQPGVAAQAARMKANIAETGVPTQIEWQQTKWGTKWTPSADNIRPPRILDATDYDAYEEFGDATIISYEMETAWSQPTGYAEELARWCREHGLGLRWWYSHEDGGTGLNPRTDEHETIWAEYDEVATDIEELSKVDLAALLVTGPRTTPTTDAMAPILERDMMHMLWS